MSARARICFAIGTRPEYIKTYPVISALRKRDDVESYLLESTQHKDLLNDAYDFFGLRPDFSLALDLPEFKSLSDGIFQAGSKSDAQHLAEMAVAISREATEFLLKEKPDLLIVQGDTLSALHFALAAWYLAIPVAHIEAGLRTYDIREPYPEEFSRRTIDHLSTLNFAPTVRAMDQLLEEKTQSRNFLTGNTVIDTLAYVTKLGLPPNSLSGKLPNASPSERSLLDGAPYVLVTAHRRENQTTIIPELAKALRKAAQDIPHYNFVIIQHANPLANAAFEAELGSSGLDNIKLLGAQAYPNFLSLLASADLVISDSGGVQEEAPYFDVPILLLRNKTERPESLERGLSLKAGRDAESIYKQLKWLLIEDCSALALMREASRKNPCLYGDAKAAERIAQHCVDFLVTQKTIAKV